MSIESIPQTWTEADDTFFSMVARLFSPAFTAGASVLLASFDIDTFDTELDPVLEPVASTLRVHAAGAVAR